MPASRSAHLIPTMDESQKQGVRDVNVAQMLAELDSLETESSLHEEIEGSTSANNFNNTLSRSQQNLSQSASQLSLELDLYENEFLCDLQNLTAESAHDNNFIGRNSFISESRDATKDNSELIVDSNLSTNTRVHASETVLDVSAETPLLLVHNDDDEVENHQPSSTMLALETPLASSAFDASSSALIADETTSVRAASDFLNRFIDAQLCQRLNTSIHNVNRIQPDYGHLTAVAACSECIMVGSSGGYLLAFDAQAEKVIARFDRADALGAVTALDVNTRGTRALCGYARGHVALIDLQRSSSIKIAAAADKSSQSPTVVSGEFLKTVSVASPLPSAILQVKFCSPAGGNNIDDTNNNNNITCICLESGGSVFRLRFRRFLNIVTCDTDCIFSGARGEAFLIEPFVPTTAAMPEQHALRASQLLALGTLNKVLLVSLTDGTIDVFLNIPLSFSAQQQQEHHANSNHKPTSRDSIISHRSSTSTGNRGYRNLPIPENNNDDESGGRNSRSSSNYSDYSHTNTVLSQNDEHRRTSLSSNNRHLPCAAWTFAAVQMPAINSSATVQRDPVVAVTCGLQLMLFHIHRREDTSSVRRLPPVGRLMKRVNFEQQQQQQQSRKNEKASSASPLLTSIVNVKWMSTSMLLLFDATGSILLYDLKLNQIVDSVVPVFPVVPSSSSSALLAKSDTLSLSDAKTNGSVDTAGSTENAETDDRTSIIRRLFSHRTAYAGGSGGAGSGGLVVSEAMARAGEFAAYMSVSSSTTVLRQPKHSVSGEFDDGETGTNNNNFLIVKQRVFCLFDNNSLACLRLRTWKERLDELERRALYVDGLEFLLQVCEAKAADGSSFGNNARVLLPPRKRVLLPHAMRNDLHRLLMNIASQLAAQNAMVVQQATTLRCKNVAENSFAVVCSLDDTKSKFADSAAQVQSAMRLCFSALGLLLREHHDDAVGLLNDFYNLISFHPESAPAVENSGVENHHIEKNNIYYYYNLLCQSASPEIEFFIYLPSLLHEHHHNDSLCELNKLMPLLIKNLIDIIQENIFDNNDRFAVSSESSYGALTEYAAVLYRKMRTRLVNTFQRLTIEVDVNCLTNSLIESILHVARRLNETHTIMCVSIDVKQDYVGPLREFLNAMREFILLGRRRHTTANGELHYRESVNSFNKMIISSNEAFEHVGNNVIFYFSENLKGRRCIANSNDSSSSSLIADEALRRRVQTDTWHLLLHSAGGGNDNNSTLRFLLHFNAKDLLNALQMCYADGYFCDAVSLDERNLFITMLMKIMIATDDDSDSSTSFLPTQIGHLFTFIARLISSSSAESSNNNVVNVNRALLEQILHNLCCAPNIASRRKKASGEDALNVVKNDDERESALMDLYQSGALQCLSEAFIVEKAKKAQFLSLIKLIYNRSGRFSELFSALLECIIEKFERQKNITVENAGNIDSDADNNDDEISELFAVARQIILASSTDDAVNSTNEQFALTLLNNIQLLGHMNAEQTSFLVLQQFIKQRIAVEIISAADGNTRRMRSRSAENGAGIGGNKKIVLVKTDLQHRPSEDEVLLSILRVFDANNNMPFIIVKDDEEDQHAKTEKIKAEIKFKFVMCFWRRGLLPLNFSRSALEMAYNAADATMRTSEKTQTKANDKILQKFDLYYATGDNDDSDGLSAEAQQASARVCLLLLDWTCQQLAEDNNNNEPNKISNTILLDMLRYFYSKSTAPPALLRLLSTDEARQICRKYKISFGEAYLYELDGKWNDAFRVLFHDDFCFAVAELLKLSPDDELNVKKYFNAAMKAFESLLEFCQRTNNRIVAAVELKSDEAEVEEKLPLIEAVSSSLSSAHLMMQQQQQLSRQQMWLQVFDKFMLLMKHVEKRLAHSSDSRDEDCKNYADADDNDFGARAGDALQRLLSAMIVYNVDMLPVLKQLIMSTTTTTTTKLSSYKGQKAATPRIRLILNNIITSYEYQCTLYESMTALLKAGVYQSLKHYVDGMRKRGIRVAAYTLPSHNNDAPEAHRYRRHRFQNDNENSVRMTRKRSVYCCICNQPIVYRNEYGTLKSYTEEKVDAANDDDENDDDENICQIAILHSSVRCGGANRMAHLACVNQQQQPQSVSRLQQTQQNSSNFVATPSTESNYVQNTINDTNNADDDDNSAQEECTSCE